MYTGPNIVTNGLICYLDASNIKSYPTTGSTWIDLSGNGNNWTINDPSGSSSGSFLSTSLDGYKGILINNGTSAQNIKLGKNIFTTVASGSLSSQSFTISITYNPFNATGIEVLDDSSNPSGTYTPLDGSPCFRLQPSVVNTVRGGHSGVTVGSSRYYNKQLTQTFVFDNAAQLATQYIDGTFDASAFMDYYYNISANGNLTLGSIIYYGNNLYYKLKYFTVQIYNRALSASEVTQNYNATKTRFGIA